MYVISSHCYLHADICVETHVALPVTPPLLPHRQGIFFGLVKPIKYKLITNKEAFFTGLGGRDAVSMVVHVLTPAKVLMTHFTSYNTFLCAC